MKSIRESKESKRKRASEILVRLKGAYPDAKVGLNFNTPFELLIATILSAQCTDERVNIVTQELFKKYQSPNDVILTSVEELEQDIYSTGFYRNKAKNIKACCEVLLMSFQGHVPDNMEDLLKLPGVGRKTANCVLSNCFNIPGLTVDTHVNRISNLLGLVKGKDPVQIEYKLMDLIPKDSWNDYNLYVITHGRRTCKARSPMCKECVISSLCPSAVVL